jgi:hypothetical protein
MFSTSLAAAVAGLMAVGTLPDWQTDYRKALAQAATEQKPVAVFIARGTDGYAKLVNEGTIGSDAVGVLKQNYVALYVNTATASGKDLAKSFGMTEGLVISDRTGGVQALRHLGTVSQADLTGYLKRYSGTVAVVTTETHTAGEAAPVVAPVVAPAPVYSAPSSCPTGRCPYAR